MHGRWVRGCKLPRTYLLGTWVNSDGHRAHCVIFSGCSRARRARGSDRGCRQRAAQASACPSSWPCSSWPGWRAQSSAHRSLHERADPCLSGGTQLLQREGDRPHGAFVEVRLVAEAERRVPRVELLRALEEADDLPVLVGVRGHPVPGFRREGWRACLDDGMEPLAHGAIRFRHLGDLREHGALPGFRLQLFSALLHRGSFLVRECLGLLIAGGALGGLLRGLLCAHRSLLCGLSHVLLSGCAVHPIKILMDGGFSTPF